MSKGSTPTPTPESENCSSKHRSLDRGSSGLPALIPPDSCVLPRAHNPALRDRWFKSSPRDQRGAQFRNGSWAPFLLCPASLVNPISSMSFGALLDISFVKLLTNRRIIV